MEGIRYYNRYTGREEMCIRDSHITLLHFQRALMEAADVMQHVPEGGGSRDSTLETVVKLGKYPWLSLIHI